MTTRTVVPCIRIRAAAVNDACLCGADRRPVRLYIRYHTTYCGHITRLTRCSTMCGRAHVRRQLSCSMETYRSRLRSATMMAISDLTLVRCRTSRIRGMFKKKFCCCGPSLMDFTAAYNPSSITNTQFCSMLQTDRCSVERMKHDLNASVTV